MAVFTRHRLKCFIVLVYFRFSEKCFFSSFLIMTPLPCSSTRWQPKQRLKKKISNLNERWTRPPRAEWNSKLSTVTCSAVDCTPRTRCRYMVVYSAVRTSKAHLKVTSSDTKTCERLQLECVVHVSALVLFWTLYCALGCRGVKDALENQKHVSFLHLTSSLQSL